MRLITLLLTLMPITLALVWMLLTIGINMQSRDLQENTVPATLNTIK
jgi:hypothetical protein